MNDELNDPKIEKLLEPLRSVPPRDRTAAVQGRGRFLSQAATLRNTQPIPQKHNALAALFSPAFMFRKQKLAVLATFMVILAMLFGGTTATAYAAQDSLPGETLYPVKTLVEDARLGLTFGSAAKYALLDELLSVRFTELDEMQALGMPVNTAFANRLLLQLDQMLALAASQSDEEMAANLDALYIRIMDQDRLSWYDEDEEGEAYGEGFRLRAEITTRAELMVQGTEDPIEFRLELHNRTQHNLPSDVPPEAPVSTPGGPGPGEPNGASNGTGLNVDGEAGADGSLSARPTSTKVPWYYYFFPGKTGLGTGQKGK